MEKYEMAEKKLCMVFVDLEKAFDQVPRNVIEVERSDRERNHGNHGNVQEHSRPSALLFNVINKCFLLNPEKHLKQIHLVVFETNAKNAPLIPKNDITEPKARLL